MPGRDGPGLGVQHIDGDGEPEGIVERLALPMSADVDAAKTF